MQILLVRHAAAVPRGAAIEDAARPLTPEGRKRFGRCVRGLDALGLRFDRIWHSPWKRAVETAELLQPLCDGELAVMDALARSPTSALVRQLEGDSVALVGHEPWMSELLALLLFGESASAGAFEFKKGGAAWLEGKAKPGEMTLRAFLPPKVLTSVR